MSIQTTLIPLQLLVLGAAVKLLPLCSTQSHSFNVHLDHTHCILAAHFWCCHKAVAPLQQPSSSINVRLDHPHPTHQFDGPHHLHRYLLDTILILEQ